MGTGSGSSPHAFRIREIEVYHYVGVDDNLAGVYYPDGTRVVDYATWVETDASFKIEFLEAFSGQITVGQPCPIAAYG